MLKDINIENLSNEEVEQDLGELQKIFDNEYNVTFEGNNNLSITSDSSTSNVTAKTLKFEENISSNDIKIRWDSTLNSLVFEKV